MTSDYNTVLNNRQIDGTDVCVAGPYFRRLVLRWDRKTTMYQAFFHVACLLITVRQL